MARRPRHLSAEERELWDRVARTTRPNPTREKPTKTEPSSAEKPPTPAPEDLPGLRFEPFQIGQKAKSNTTVNHPPPPAINMDAKAFRKMKRGKLKPEARIDLHGMTQAAAHTALTHFILSTQADGKRLVLVITGKGKHKYDTGPIPERPGILRYQVPQWLELPPLKERVLQVSPAHISHGGAGAYYVYLSRIR